MTSVLSWLLTGVSVVSLWVTGRSPQWGWTLCLAAQPVWVAYALTTGQPGFLVSAVTFSIIFSRNLVIARGTKATRR